jgi:hypothetical protein
MFTLTAGCARINLTYSVAEGSEAEQARCNTVLPSQSRELMSKEGEWEFKGLGLFQDFPPLVLMPGVVDDDKARELSSRR